MMRKIATRSARRIAFVIGLMMALGLSSCRSQLGGKCAKKDDCALGLYCDLEKEVCADRGQLLKKEAEKIYIFPIPSKVKPR
ncbi:MAG: hypothetical protein VX589_04105 [Myxococcota bacterium]|nr:hypothetical protein [Myxococcota bacterium]